MLNKLLSFLLVGLLAFTVVGCDDDDDNGDTDNTSPTAQVRFFHAAPTAGQVDVALEGTLVADNFVYRGVATNPNVSGYFDVPVDAGALTVTTSGGDEVVNVNVSSLGLDADARYTVVVAGTPPNVQPILLSDNNFPTLESDQIGLRIVHAASTVPGTDGPVDVYLGPPTVTVGDDISTIPADQLAPVAQGFTYGSAFPPVPVEGAFAAQPVSTPPAAVLVTPAGDNTVVIAVDAGTLGLTLGSDYATAVAIDPGTGSTDFGALALIEQAP